MEFSECFVKEYSPSYFLSEKRIVPGLHQSSKFIENEIEKILQNGIQTELDVMHILAWKIGKIRHKESQAQKFFIYHSDWESADKMNVKRYGKDMNIKPFVQKIIKNIHTLEKLVEEDEPQAVLNELASYLKETKGIGTVYLITLLFFISKGKYPIYDRYAIVAIKALKEELSPEHDTVQYSELPAKKSGKFKSVFADYMEDYIHDIESFCKKLYQTNRDIDRALWVYGHKFKLVQKNHTC